MQRTRLFSTKFILSTFFFFKNINFFVFFFFLLMSRCSMCVVYGIHVYVAQTRNIQSSIIMMFKDFLHERLQFLSIFCDRCQNTRKSNTFFWLQRSTEFCVQIQTTKRMSIDQIISHTMRETRLLSLHCRH